MTKYSTLVVDNLRTIEAVVTTAGVLVVLKTAASKVSGRGAESRLLGSVASVSAWNRVVESAMVCPLLGLNGWRRDAVRLLNVAVAATCNLPEVEVDAVVLKAPRYTAGFKSDVVAAVVESGLTTAEWCRLNPGVASRTTVFRWCQDARKRSRPVLRLVPLAG
jgi:hypothetical protein